jgi:hypothetical protein
MSRTPARFTEADLRRAIRAVAKEGVPMAVEAAPDGTIRIVPYEPPAQVSPERPPGRAIEQERRPVL